MTWTFLSPTACRRTGCALCGKNTKASGLCLRVYKSPTMARKTGSTNSPSQANVWQGILQTLQPGVNVETFKTWLKPTRLLPSSNGKLRISVPNREFKHYIEEKFLPEIQKAARKEGFEAVELYPEIPDPAPAVEEPEETEEQLPARRDSGACPKAPEEAWCGLAKEYRKVIGPRIESSDNFNLAGFLTMAGAGLGKSVHMNQGGIIYPNFYTVIVGESGWSRKSLAMAPILDLIPAVNPGIIPFYDLSSGEGLIRAINDSLQDAPDKNQASVLVMLDEYNQVLLKSKQKGNTLIPVIKRAFGTPHVLEVPSS